MSHLHDHGILHGDLSSNNMLLTSCDKDPRRFTVKVRPLNRLLTTCCLLVTSPELLMPVSMLQKACARAGVQQFLNSR